jgi:hypothetical protein
MDPASISPAVADADAVITAIAPHGTGPGTLRHDSTRSIMQAMGKTGTRRLLFISGSIVTDEGESPYLRYLIKPVVRHTFLRHVNADFLATEQEIHASDLDWTIFRPPSLTNKPAREPTAPQPTATCPAASPSRAQTSPACSAPSTTPRPSTGTYAPPADTPPRHRSRPGGETPRRRSGYPGCSVHVGGGEVDHGPLQQRPDALPSYASAHPTSRRLPVEDHRLAPMCTRFALGLAVDGRVAGM